MNAVNAVEVMQYAKGLTFFAIGPFLVADLSSTGKVFNHIPVGKYGMEKVGSGEKTEGHTHEFASFYKSEALNIESEGKTYRLPRRALTLVLPGLAHSWVPQSESVGVVGSVDTRHQQQVIVAV